jgi:hypothetical protein
METVKQYISQYNEILSILGLLIGILGIVLAFVFYKKSLRIRNSYYQKKSFNLISTSLSQLPHLEVKYKNNSVSDLTVTKIAIWNSGNETIDRKELVELDPLRIVPEEGVVIYDCEVIDVIEETNNFKVISENNYFKLEFDYFDPKQGCSLKIFHSGKGSSDVSVRGKFKGQGEISENDNVGGNTIEYRMQYSKMPTFIKEQFIIVAKFGWLIYLFATIGSLVFSFYEGNFWILLVTVFCAFATYVMFPKGQVPKQLQKIFSDDK